MNPTKRTHLARTLTSLALLTHPQLQTLEEITFYEPLSQLKFKVAVDKNKTTISQAINQVIEKMKTQQVVSENFTKEGLEFYLSYPSLSLVSHRMSYCNEENTYKELEITKKDYRSTFKQLDNYLVKVNLASKKTLPYLIYKVAISRKVKLAWRKEEEDQFFSQKTQYTFSEKIIKSVIKHINSVDKGETYQKDQAIYIYGGDIKNKQYQKLYPTNQSDLSIKQLIIEEKLFKLDDPWLITLDDKGDTYKPKPSHAGYDLLHNTTTNQENNNKPQEHENSEVKEPENEEERKENNKENKPNYPLINPNDNNVENNNKQSDETEYFLTYCQDTRSQPHFHIVKIPQTETETLDSIKNTLIKGAHDLHIFTEEGWTEISHKRVSQLKIDNFSSNDIKPPYLFTPSLLKETFPLHSASKESNDWELIHKGAPDMYGFNDHQPAKRYKQVYDGIIDQLKHILKNKEAKPTPPNHGPLSNQNTNDGPINNNKPLNDSNDDANNDDDKNSSNMGYYMLGAVGIISLSLITLPFIIKKHKKKSSNTMIEKV